MAVQVSAAPLVRTDVVDGVATLTLDDVPRRNSVTAQLSLAVEAACRSVAIDPGVRAVVLAAAGPAFSAGGDLGSLTDRSGSLGTLYRGFGALAALAVPTLAAVNGPAVGAGMNFALACDVIIAAESARFDPRFLDVGIHPGGGHLWRLQHLAGRQAAAALVLFGESLTGQQAAAHGVAWACVPDADLLPTAQAMAGRVARRSAELVRRTKASLAASVPMTNPRAAVELEQAAQEWSMSRPAFRDGVAALQRKLAARH
jgi:enoyl-CoA hydratase